MTGTCREHWNVVLHPREYGRLSMMLLADKMVLIDLGQCHFASLAFQILRSVTLKKEGLVAQQLHKQLPPARAAAIACPAQLVETFKQPSIAPFPEGALVSLGRRCFWCWLGLPQYLLYATLDFGNMRLRECDSFGSPMAAGTWLKHMSKKL